MDIKLLQNELMMSYLQILTEEYIAPYPSTFTLKDIDWFIEPTPNSSGHEQLQEFSESSDLAVCQVAALNPAGQKTNYTIHACLDSLQNEWFYEVREAGITQRLFENLTQIPKTRWHSFLAALDQILLEDVQGVTLNKEPRLAPGWQGASSLAALERIEQGIVSYGSQEIAPEAFPSASELEAWLVNDLRLTKDALTIRVFDVRAFLQANKNPLFFENVFAEEPEGNEITLDSPDFSNFGDDWFGEWYERSSAEISLIKEGHETQTFEANMAIETEAIADFLYRDDEVSKAPAFASAVSVVQDRKFYFLEFVGASHGLLFPNTGTILHVCFDNDGAMMHAQVDDLKTELDALKLEDLYSRRYGKWLDEDAILSEEELQAELNTVIEILKQNDIKKG